MSRTTLGILGMAVVLGACSDPVTAPTTATATRVTTPNLSANIVAATGCTTASQTLTSPTRASFTTTITWPVCVDAPYALATNTPSGGIGQYTYSWQGIACGSSTFGQSQYFSIANPAKANRPETYGCHYSFLLTMTDGAGNSISWQGAGFFLTPFTLPPFTPPPYPTPPPAPPKAQ
jgi:hypothetical protein